MFNFGAKGQFSPVAGKMKTVLNETGIKVVALVVRGKAVIVKAVRKIVGFDIVFRVAVAQPPEQFMVCQYGKTVLEIEVQGIPALVEVFLLPFSVVVIALHHHIGVLGKNMLPAPHQIAAGNVLIFHFDK